MTSLKRYSLLGSAAALMVPLLASSPARANVVNVGGLYYEVAISSLAYNSNPTLFNPSPAGKMPWWGDALSASGFAAQVYDQLGADIYQAGYGAIFAYGTGAIAGGQVYGIVQNTSDNTDQLDLDSTAPLSFGTVYPYAIATLTSPASVPAPLPLLGAGAALAWSRRLRTRVRISKR